MPKSLNAGLVFVCLAVSSIARTGTISCNLPETVMATATGKYTLPKLSRRESAGAPTGESEDAIVGWNALTLDIIRGAKTSPHKRSVQ